jgi:short-subunit dehydrogenase
MIVADFSELKSIDDYKKKVMWDLEFYDIGVLVLNAGTGTMGPFGEITDQEV